MFIYIILFVYLAIIKVDKNTYSPLQFDAIRLIGSLVLKFVSRRYPYNFNVVQRKAAACSIVLKIKSIHGPLN